MTLKKMAKCVLQAGYTVAIGDDLISHELDGGAPRFRRKRTGTYHQTNVSWNVNERGYQYLMAFYRIWARNPNQPFLIGLIADTGALFEHQAFFISAPVLSSKEGGRFTVTATLKFKPEYIDLKMDETLVDVSDVGSLMNPLKELTNEDLPDALEKLP